jgi:peroxiredoxin Q/BCP
MLSVGTPAPDFTLSDEKGNTITLSSFLGTQPVVLIFYPGDQTPVCTAQLCGIRDSYEDFIQAGATVFGINPGNATSHQKFSDKHNFPFPLLVDNESQTSKSYEAMLFSLGTLAVVNRTVYVINKDGIICFAERGNPPTKSIVAALAAANQA